MPYINIPPGWYKAEPVESFFDRVGAKETPCLKIVFRLVGGELDGEEVEWTGWMTAPAAPHTMDKVQLLGGEFDAQDNLTFPEGEHIQVRITQSDRGYPSVDRIGKGRGARAPSSDTEDVRSRAAEMFRSMTGAKKPEPSPWEQPKKGGEDVPF